MSLEEVVWDFLGGPVVKNPSASVGGTGSIPGLGRFHMPWGNWAHVAPLLKPSYSRAHALQQEKPPQWEARAPQLERAQVQQQRLSTAENK